MGCGLRRAELTALRVEDIQQREEHWVIADLVGKGGHIKNHSGPGLGESWNRRLDGGRPDYDRDAFSFDQQGWQDLGDRIQPQGHLGRRETESKGL